jgi:hypothetical protein
MKNAPQFHVRIMHSILALMKSSRDVVRKRAILALASLAGSTFPGVFDEIASALVANLQNNSENLIQSYLLAISTIAKVNPLRMKNQVGVVLDAVLEFVKKG